MEGSQGVAGVALQESFAPHSVPSASPQDAAGADSSHTCTRVGAPLHAADTASSLSDSPLAHETVAEQDAVRGDGNAGVATHAGSAGGDEQTVALPEAAAVGVGGSEVGALARAPSYRQQILTCEAVFASPEFSSVADPLTSPRWVTLLHDTTTARDHLAATVRNEEDEGPEGMQGEQAQRESASRLERDQAAQAIVASDSPIKGIIFSRTINESDFHPSPRGDKSPRKSSSPRKTTGRKTVAEVKAELGFLEQPSGPRGVAHVTSAEDVVLGNKSWDVTISSLTPRSVHDTFDTTEATSHVNTPRVVPPRALLPRQVVHLATVACEKTVMAHKP
jgi:hypothetical protein